MSSVVRINIDQQFAQIGVRSSHARMQISMPKGQMRLNDNKAQIQVETQMPTFRVPRERLRNESGLAGPVSFAKRFRDKGRQAAGQATRNYASDGDYIKNLRIPGDKSIPALSKRRMDRFFNSTDYNIGLMPSSPPSLEWTRGYINVSASRHNFSVDWNGENLADINVDSGYPVEVSLTRRHNVSISSVVPAVENQTMGRYIDRMV